MSENYESRKVMICRVCLMVINKQFDVVDEITKESFDVLSIKLNFAISENPVICDECVETTNKSINFKSVCVDTEELVTSFANGRQVPKFQIRDMYEDNRDDSYDTKNFNICRFCISPVDIKNFVSLDTLKQDATFNKMLFEYMSEMDFNIIENTIICSTCRTNLECYFKFIRNCHNVEEKINMYCQQEKIGDGGQVNLCHMLHFSFNGILDCSDNDFRKNHIKQETIKSEDIGNNYSEANIELMIVEEKLAIKDEGGNFSVENYHIPFEANLTTKDNATKECLKIDINKCMEYTARQKESFKSDELNVHRCTEQLVLKSHMETLDGTKKRKLINKDISQTKMYKCSLCDHQTKYKRALDKHLLVHTDICDMYKCPSCPYETKSKGNLHRHALIHKSASEVKMYKCSLCTYETKDKCSLKRHMLTHKDISERETYKCSVCGYKTLHRYFLKSHMLVHKDISEIQLYKCSQCSYKTKEKGNFTRHTLVHKDFSETEIYKCPLCAHQTKHKHSMKAHMLVHKDISEAKVYKCTSCDYVARQKHNLKIHMALHDDVTEMDTYKCSLCPYTSKRERNFKRHMLVHKDTSKEETYRCPSCSYETKRKDCLKSHMNVHKDSQKYKCFSCDYKSNQKPNLRRHIMSMHVNVS